LALKFLSKSKLYPGDFLRDSRLNSIPASGSVYDTPSGLPYVSGVVFFSFCKNFYFVSCFSSPVSVYGTSSGLPDSSGVVFFSFCKNFYFVSCFSSSSSSSPAVSGSVVSVSDSDSPYYLPPKILLNSLLMVFISSSDGSSKAGDYLVKIVI